MEHEGSGRACAVSSEVAVLCGRSDLQRSSSRQEFALEWQVLCGCRLLLLFGWFALDAISVLAQLDTN